MNQASRLILERETSELNKAIEKKVEERALVEENLCQMMREITAMTRARDQLLEDLHS